MMTGESMLPKRLVLKITVALLTFLDYFRPIFIVFQNAHNCRLCRCRNNNLKKGFCYLTLGWGCIRGFACDGAAWFASTWLLTDYDGN